MFVKIEESYSQGSTKKEDVDVIWSSCSVYECDCVTHEVIKQANGKYERVLRLWKDKAIKYDHHITASTLGYFIMNDHGETIDSYHHDAKYFWNVKPSNKAK